MVRRGISPSGELGLGGSPRRLEREKRVTRIHRAALAEAILGLFPNTPPDMLPERPTSQAVEDALDDLRIDDEDDTINGAWLAFLYVQDPRLALAVIRRLFER